MLRYTTLSATDICHSESPLVLDRRPEVLDLPRPFTHVRLVSPLPDRLHHETAAPSSLATRLSAFISLGHEERDALDLLSRNAKRFRSDQILIHEGSAPDSVYLVVRGLACRYKMLPGGRRQILGYLIPGDLCDIHFAIARPDHSVASVGEATVARIPHRKISELIARFPTIGRALTLAALVDSVILREWLLSVGQRDAMQSLSHFFCEMAVRLEAIGETNEDGSFDLPVNQTTLADTLGLTPVHINRTLQKLRNDGLIKFCQKRLSIVDRNRLAIVAGFDDSYLRVRLFD